MFKNKKISVVIPAYNEEKQITKVLYGIPKIVDLIIVIDDCSTDNTLNVIKKYKKGSKKNILTIKHDQNQGVGGAIASGYKKAIEEKIDITVVMAGDNQMDPRDFKNIIDPIIRGQAEYTKGNRLFGGESWKMIPHIRYLGNAFLSLLTKIASGYWHIADSQCGYTAISIEALKKLNLDNVYKRYGVPNDLLIKLNILNCRVKDIPVRPVYNVGEKSKLKISKVMPKISWLLLSGFVKRLVIKYVINDFHPLVFFYAMTFILGICSVGLLIRLIYWRLAMGDFPPSNSLALVFTTIMGFQSLFFSMWFDMEYNKNLR